MWSCRLFCSLTYCFFHTPSRSNLTTSLPSSLNESIVVHVDVTRFTRSPRLLSLMKPMIHSSLHCNWLRTYVQRRSGPPRLASASEAHAAHSEFPCLLDAAAMYAGTSYDYGPQLGQTCLGCLTPLLHRKLRIAKFAKVVIGFETHLGRALGWASATNDGLGYQAKLWTAATRLYGRRKRSSKNCFFTPSISFGRFHVHYFTCLALDCVEICVLPLVRQAGFCLLPSRCIRIVHRTNENLEASSHARCTNPVWVPGLLSCMNDL